MPNKLHKEQVNFGDAVFLVKDFIAVFFCFAKLVHLARGVDHFTFYFLNLSC